LKLNNPWYVFSSFKSLILNFMEIINKENRIKVWGESDIISESLLTTIESAAKLKQLLEWYFSMVEHLEDVDHLVSNLDYYDETLLKLISFSKTTFMEKTVWRVSDNWEFREYCWAHLRNLVSPFKNMIALIKGFSEGKVNIKLLKSFKDKLSLDNNKKDLLEFCDFLEKNN